MDLASYLANRPRGFKAELAKQLGVSRSFLRQMETGWGVILGILFGLFTLLMNWYYKDKELKLKEKYFKKQVSVKDLDDEQKS